MSDLDTLEAGIRHVAALLGVVDEDRSPLAIASALDAVRTVGVELRGAQSLVHDPAERDSLFRLDGHLQRLAHKLRAMLPQALVR